MRIVFNKQAFVSTMYSSFCTSQFLRQSICMFFFFKQVNKLEFTVLLGSIKILYNVI